MSPEEWPIRSPAERGSLALAGSAGRDRLSTARQDFFLPSTQRLTEQERALMTAMLHRLVGDIATEIQALMPRDWLPANEDNSALIDRLWHSGLLDIEPLIALLLRRADEERINVALNARHGNRAGSMIQPLVSSDDAEIAAAAMALLIARGRRRDRYAQPLIELDDVPPEAAAGLVHAVAAALAERKPLQLSGSDAEQGLCKAARALLTRHDPMRSLDHLTGELVRLLEDRQQLDEARVRLAIDSGEIAVLCHAFASRAGSHWTVGFAELLSGDPRRIMLLLRLADIPREIAGHLFATLGDLLGMNDRHAFAHFDGFTPDRLDATRSQFALDPRFKNALKALGNGNGSL